MQKNDFGRFAKALYALGEVFNREMSESLVEIYFESLKDFDISQFERASYLAINKCKFFPKPAELREFVEGTADDTAQNAWQLFVTACERVGFYKSIWAEDAALIGAIRLTFGGWTQACTAMHPIYDDDGNQIGGLSPEMVAARRKEFLLNYRAAQRRGSDERYLLGNVEIENRANIGSFKRGTLQAKQSVGVVLADHVGTTELAFDPHTGQLASQARLILEGGEIRRLLSSAPRLALPPAPDYAEPVMSLDEAIENVSDGLAMLRDGLPENLRTKRKSERIPVDIAARYDELRQQVAMLEAEDKKEAAQ